MDWLAAAQGAIAETNQSMGAQSARLASRAAVMRRELERAIRATTTELDNADAARARGVDHDRVLRLINAQRFESLTSREVRYAARLLEALSASDFRRLLAARSEAARHFVKACLERWHLLLRAREPVELAGLLAAHVAGERCVRSGAMTTAAIAALEAPNLLADRLDAVSFGSVPTWLEKCGLDLRWSLVGHALAAWLERRVVGRQTLDEPWDLIVADPRLSGAVLPRKDGEDIVVRTGHAPLEPRCRAILALFRAGTASRPLLSGSKLDDVIGWALASSLGDPRIPPESEGWRLIRQRDEGCYRTILERLIQEDLEVFFDHAMHEKDRRAFWLNYLGAIRRTTCVLSPGKYESLRQKLGASRDKKLRSAVERACRFRSSSAAQAFCIVFDRYAIVEFSDSGNAAYVYRRADFEELFERKLREGRIVGHGDLKNQDRAVRRLNHYRDWEEDMRRWLGSEGIHPSPAVDARFRARA